jgi:hypothetical protein
MLRSLLLLLLAAMLPFSGSYAQGYIVLNGIQLHQLNTDTRLGNLTGRNFGLWLEGTEDREMYIQMGTDALFPLLAGVPFKATAKRRDGIFTGGYSTADVSLFTWRQGATTKLNVDGADVMMPLAFSFDWRHISRPVAGDRSENYFGMGFMAGLYTDGDELADIDFLSFLAKDVPDNATVGLKAGYEAVVTEKGSRSLWAEALIGIPIERHDGIMIMPGFASRKLLAYNVVTQGHAHKNFNTLSLKIGFYKHFN